MVPDVDDEASLCERVAELIDQGNVVGHMAGRGEFGPRALGNRSILGDARSSEMQATMNLKIKYRESFRPFAPSVLEEESSSWFDIDRPSPYMLLVAQVREDKREIPAVTHVDGSARIQTVDAVTNPLYHKMIKRFDEKTGCAVIINTSFNVRGEPIVCTPYDGFMCFMRTNMDVLMMDRFYLEKADQKPLEDDVDIREIYALD